MEQARKTADAAHREQAELLEVQRRTWLPWPRHWNWLLDRPSRGGAGMRVFQAAALLFSAIGVGIFRLTPVFGPPTSTAEIVFGILGVLLLPVGLAWAWSAYRIRQYCSS